MASSCASDIRSVTGVMVASSSLGISDATTRTNSTGCVHAAVISAGLPKTPQARSPQTASSGSILLPVFPYCPHCIFNDCDQSILGGLLGCAVLPKAFRELAMVATQSLSDA